LPFAFGGGVVNLAAAGVECGEQVERALALILALYAHGLSGLGRKSLGFAGARLQASLLIHAKHHFIRRQLARVQIAQIQDCGGESRIPWGPRGKPQMMTPWLEVVAVENAPYALRGDLAHHSLGHQLAGQFGAVPLAQAAAS